MNNSSIYKALLFFFLIFLSGFGGICQVNDAGLWLSANVQKKITQSVSVNFSQEVRLMENISEASTIFSDLGLEYKFNKHFKLSFNYRHVNNRRLDDSYETRNRYYFDMSYRQKMKPFVLIVRERMQSEFAPFNSGENINPKLYSRTKATLKLDLDLKITPYFYTELFSSLNNYSARKIDKFRDCAGLEYQFSPRHMIDLNYMIQNKLDSKRENDYIIGLGYYFTL